MKIFRYLQGKDLFEAFYKKHLSKRLLLGLFPHNSLVLIFIGKSSNSEIERSMLGKMRMVLPFFSVLSPLIFHQECGVDYTSKLDGMFGDIDLARNVLQAYKQSMTEKQSLSTSSTSRITPIETEIMVLTTSYWPTYPTIEMKIPPEILHQMVPFFFSFCSNLSQELFSTFYNEKYQGRRLTWQHSTERCIVTARFPKGKKELELSLLQVSPTLWYL